MPTSMTDSMKQGPERNRPPARDPAGLQRGKRHHSGIDCAAAGYVVGKIVEADYVDLADQERGHSRLQVAGRVGCNTSRSWRAICERRPSEFEFEKAAKLRDTIKELRTKEFLFA